MSVLGMIEFSSIAIGIRASDAMVKAAPVDLFESRPISPGRYMSLVTGEVAAVESSVGAGVNDAGADGVVESFVLANLHDYVLPALGGPDANMNVEAIGVIETSSAASAVEAADAACKASPVQSSCCDCISRTILGVKGIWCLRERLRMWRHRSRLVKPGRASIC